MSRKAVGLVMVLCALVPFISIYISWLEYTDAQLAEELAKAQANESATLSTQQAPPAAASPLPQAAATVPAKTTTVLELSPRGKQVEVLLVFSMLIAPRPLCPSLEQWTPEMHKWLAFFEAKLVPLREEIKTSALHSARGDFNPSSDFFLADATVGAAQGDVLRAVEALEAFTARLRWETDLGGVWGLDLYQVRLVLDVLGQLVYLKAGTPELMERAFAAVAAYQSLVHPTASVANSRVFAAKGFEEWQERGFLESVEEMGINNGVRSWLWAGPLCRPFFNKDALTHLGYLERLEKITRRSPGQQGEDLIELQREIESLSLLYPTSKFVIDEVGRHQARLQLEGQRKLLYIAYLAQQFALERDAFPQTLDMLALTKEMLEDPLAGETLLYERDAVDPLKARVFRKMVIEVRPPDFVSLPLTSADCSGLNEVYVFPAAQAESAFQYPS